MPPAPTVLSKTVVRAVLALTLAGVWWLELSGQSTVQPGGDIELPFALREVSSELGIEFEHRACRVDPRLKNIEPHVSGLGASVGVCDANGDGRPDLFTTSSAFGSASALFVNRGGDHFEDVAASAGLAQLSDAEHGAAMGSIWADADGDGDQDVFVYRYGMTQLMRNDGDLRFSDVTAESGVGRWMNSNAATWIDFDRDGRLDLFVGGYFDEAHDLFELETTRIMQTSFEFAENGGRNVLFHNLGGLRFEDVSDRVGLDSTRWAMAAVAVDMNADGWTDLYVANDYGPEEYFENVGGERFESRVDVGLAESSKSGMCVAVGDFDNSGALGVFVSNISRRGYLFQGNNLRLNRLAENDRLYNVSDTAAANMRAVTDCGWAWGAQFGDLDNDGLEDLYVANGFISASEDEEYWYDMTKVAGGAGGVFADATNWPPIGEKSLSGYERSRVLWNRGRQRFTEVGQAAGISDRYDGRAVAMADLGGRGALDVIVANQKGPLLIYRSEPDPAHAWVQVLLRAADGNSSAVGAQVELVETSGRRQTRAVLAGSGFSAQNDLALHFGLGLGGQVAGLTVRWPSGRVQELGPLESRKRHFIEETIL